MTSVAALELAGVNLIGDSDVTGHGPQFHATDPATGRRLEPAYHDATAEDVDRAAALAWAAFPIYRRTSLAQRAAFLDSIADEIEALGIELIERVHAETGIPTARVTGEIARTTGQLRLFAAVVREGSWTQARLDTADPARTPLPKPDLRQRAIPLGPVAVFSASNFPLAFSVAGGDTASALAAGAPVIVKAHPGHPGTSELIGRAIRRSVQKNHLPPGTFSMLLGAGHEVGVALVTDPRIRAVGFTGSRSGGLALAAAANSRPIPIPVYAEMSSVNPVFVLPGALAENPADLGRAFVASLNTGVGQLCTSPGLVFVAEGPGADAFIAAASEAVSATPAAAMLSGGLAAGYADGVDRLAAHPAVTAAARGSEDATLACSGVATLFVTTVDEFLAGPDIQDEVFGPASVVVRVPQVDDLLTVIDRIEGQLTATIHATESDYAVAGQLVERLELLAGRVVFNAWPTGVEVGHAVVHGGPFPATTAPSTTSVGARAIERFLRPVAYQNVPEGLLAPELRSDNPWGIPRRIDGVMHQT